jgi:hypothetical protein
VNELKAKVNELVEAYFKSMHDTGDPIMVFHGEEVWNKQAQRAAVAMNNDFEYILQETSDKLTNGEYYKK